MLEIIGSETALKHLNICNEDKMSRITFTELNNIIFIIINKETYKMAYIHHLNEQNYCKDFS